MCVQYVYVAKLFVRGSFAVRIPDSPASGIWVSLLSVKPSDTFHQTENHFDG